MKFDLVILIKRLIDFPDFIIQGSITSLKGLKVGNIVFRDLLKICPFGSLNKQAEFWNTETRKGHIDHDGITVSKITEMDLKNDNEDKKLRDEIISYCIRDCVVLGECAEKYKEWVRANLQICPYVISTAGLALRYFSTRKYVKKGKEMIR